MDGRPHRIAVWVLGWAGLWLAGCGAQPDKKMSVPPQRIAVNPPESKANDTEKRGIVRVFYATDRQATGKTEAKDYFGSGRGELQLGWCDVSIPPNHKPGELESPSVWKLEFRENKDKHVVLLNVQPAFGPRYLEEVRKRVANSKEREAFVFVHGYNVTFADAARRTAQMAYDLRFDGAPIFYSWPAKGDLLDYGTDGNNAEWSVAHLTDFLTGVARQTGAQEIHLIAHSMGNRVLVGALKSLAYQAGREPLPKFNQVVLTAPDIDAAIFKRDIAPRIVSTAQRITIYASERDKALTLSQRLHGYPRLGDAGRNITLFPEWPNIEVVDASAVETGILGHSYYGDSATVLDDLEFVLSGLGGSDRGLLPQRSGAYWSFPPSRSAGSAPTVRR